MRTGVTGPSARTVLCWVDAGPAFGLGHVSRTLALAEALAAHGITCRFALPDDPTARAWLEAAGMLAPLVLPDREPALPHVLPATARVDAVIVDVRRPLGRDEVRALGGTCPVLVIDNAGDGVAEADLVLAPYVPGGARDERWLTGPEHVPLRWVFRDVRPERTPGQAPVVLVSMGASDPGGLTVPVIQALARLEHEIDVRVVANPAAPVWGALPALLARAGFAPPRAVEPAGTAAHLAAADVAVLAMGVTVYEAMACGVPAVVLCRTSGDAAHARALSARGAIESLGVYWTEERIAEVVGRLVASTAARAAMARAARGTVDGRGAERVAARLVARLAGEVDEHAGARLRLG